jgi:serine/threonine protein kinase
MSGPRSKPPVLAGYRYREFLGDGGFADVFLYEKLHPAREVAIKVLRASGLDAEARRAFEAEANLMAKVSEHPYIVTVYDAATADDGRPYLVMEYYSEPHYGRRAAEGGIGVAEVLRLGVQVSSAVEVAHREGILHRDIKPANILVNRYGRPGLTDFGIAGTKAGEQAGQGWSVPYAPPEILRGDHAGDVASDVYSLAATLYTILAGRSPFAMVGGRNTGEEVTARVLNEPVPPTGRADVPPALEHLLRQALSKDPASRPPSALSFARSLQAVQRERRMELTHVEVPEAPPPRPIASPNEPDLTRSGAPLVLRPVAQPPRPPTAQPSELVTGVPASVRVTAPAPQPALPIPGPQTSDTVHRPPRPAPETDIREVDHEPLPAARMARPVRLVAGLVVALVAVAAIYIGLTRESDPGAGNPSAVDDTPAEVFADRPASVATVALRAAGGSAEVTWVHAGRKPGDRYRVSQVGAPNAAPLAEVDASPAKVAYAGGCVQVVVVRDAYQSEPTVGCPG